tara:strand:- start:196 stop:534 length:339 start_codon:yes stop_codon:yes gene_type:complete
MSTLVTLFKEDKLALFRIKMISQCNQPFSFRIDDKVVVLTGIDSHLSLDNMKPGMVGTIGSIMHRYKGQPAEHIEYWVYSNGNKSRYNINQIIKYDVAEKFIKEYYTDDSEV